MLSKKKSGFTLIEVMVVLAIFGILMIVAAEFFISVIKSSARATLQAETRQNAQQVMQKIIDDIRSSSSFSISNVPGPTLNDLVITNATGTITYHVDSDGANPGPVGKIWSIYRNGSRINTDAVAILNCGGNGCGTSCSGPAVSGLSLVKNSNGTLNISLVVQQRAGSGTSTTCAITTLSNSAQPRVY
ncbi:type II secretion system protein [Candidatus Microgenomates bacterium]|nr:type II secretion system protein [Candidatus Microgenomates bacterium]